MELLLSDLLHADQGEKHFSTRPFGERFYPRLGAWIQSTLDGSVLRVVVPADRFIDYSFADETLGRIYKELVDGKWGDRYLLTDVAEESQFRDLGASIRLRKIAALVRFGTTYHLVVNEDTRGLDELRQTVALVNQYRRVTAGDLSRDHGLSPTTWNNRLVRAHQLRLIYREPEALLGGGRQYVYGSLLHKDGTAG